MPQAPLTDVILVAVSQLVDDAQTSRRDPSHSDLETLFKRCDATAGDPVGQGTNVGKAKRVRSVLSWALESDIAAGEQVVASLIGTIRGHGGFRPGSTNYVGDEAIQNATAAFASEGYVLAPDGDLRPQLLDGISGAQLTDALRAYIRRGARSLVRALSIFVTSPE